jgi:hypothetical protein
MGLMQICFVGIYTWPLLYVNVMDLKNKLHAVNHQVRTVISAGVIGIAILLIILIYDQVSTALPTPTAASLATATTNVTNTFASAMELAPVIILVLIASIVIAVVQRFR